MHLRLRLLGISYRYSSGNVHPLPGLQQSPSIRPGGRDPVHLGADHVVPREPPRDRLHALPEQRVQRLLLRGIREGLADRGLWGNGMVSRSGRRRDDSITRTTSYR